MSRGIKSKGGLGKPTIKQPTMYQCILEQAATIKRLGRPWRHSDAPDLSRLLEYAVAHVRKSDTRIMSYEGRRFRLEVTSLMRVIVYTMKWDCLASTNFFMV